ncbi:MAG: rhodanese-like domain-containing protein [Acidimicrobiales bacterium]|nr:MAG: hypothetical protein B7Z69_04130 [Actinobacteria bacterium 21-73-9]
MADSLHRDDVRRLMAQDDQLAEVPGAEYDEEHLLGAINIPLKRLGPKTVTRLDRARPVIAYCWDGL